ERAVGDELDGRPRVVRDEVEKPAQPVRGAGGGAPLAADLGLRDVDEPDDIPGRGRVRPEEGACPENEVPRLGAERRRQGSAAGDATEVGQPDVATGGRCGVYGRTHSGTDSIGPDNEVSAQALAVGKGHCCRTVL